MEDTQPVLSDQSTQSAVKKVRRGLWLIIILIVLALLSPFVVTAVMLYGSKTTNSFTERMTTWLPYPAAIVNGDWLLFRDYEKSAQDAIRVTQQFAADQNLVAQLGAVPSPEEIAADEYNRMIQVLVLEQLAEQYEVTATTEEIDQVYTEQILSQVQGDETQVAETINQLYGWTIEQFKEQVIRELVLRQKLQTKLAEDPNGDFTKLASDRIKEVQTQIQADPAKFADLAKEYSEDSSAELGGDLGWFEKGVMVQPFEEAAFALTEPNQVSDIVQTEFGYHLIQLIERKEATDTDPEQVHARHILVQYSFDDYLKAQVAATKVKKLIDPAMVVTQ